jgi:HK97 family phage major capsid protein
MAYQDQSDKELAAAAREARTKEPARRAPMVTTGAVYQDSKTFSMHNFVSNGIVKKAWDKAKFEGQVAQRFRDLLEGNNCLLPEMASGYLLPYNLNHFGEVLSQSSKAESELLQLKAIMNQAAVQASDPDEQEWLVRKGLIRKAQSAFVDTTGGTMIAPPVQGDVIPFIRPEAAAIAAGATQMALPPNGRFVAPRITGAPTVQALAESQEASVSDMTTDQMLLTAKKIAGATVINEEATLYSSGTIDNYVRDELNRSLGLKMDAFAFYGQGGTNIPTGISAAAISSLIVNFETDYSSSRGIGTDGNLLLPEYIDAFEALIGERSFNMESEQGAFVMRPGVWASVTGARADAVTGGDKAGPRVDLLRRTEDGKPNVWGGKKCIRTTNLRNNLTKGAGTALSDVFFGIFSHMVMATYGAIQFKEGTTGQQFTQGQKTVLATMFGDIGFRYPAAFLRYTSVKGLVAIL